MECRRLHVFHESADGEKAHSCYFSKDAYAEMVKDGKYTENKELLIIPDTVHTDLYDVYDGGGKDAHLISGTPYSRSI